VSQLAYLVIREGSKWSDVFRLVPGQTITIGRAPTNNIVLKDERCSRNHAEILVVDDQWVLRDLDSRNGTMIGESLVEGEYTLRPGDVIRVGHSQLVFVYSLSEAFSDTAAVAQRPSDLHKEWVATSSLEDSALLERSEPTTIMHRRGQTRYLAPGQPEEGGISHVGRSAAKLCRLAFEMAKAPDVMTLADVALSGLFEGTQTDAGAVLLLPRDHQGEARGEQLELIASRAANGRYQRVSHFLAYTVMREGEAVLARNVMGDSTMGSPDSKGQFHATSLICAPVRRGTTVLGVIHLYSTDEGRGPDPDDLEYTLAVAETLAVALVNLNRRQELAENLTQVRTEIVQLRERLGVQSDIIGRSPLMHKIREEIALAAASKATVLIRGESGVGKELVARAVHYNSARAKNVFVCLNCAALSEELLASELFGHERGAFTGATERKIGKFEAAHKGTIMLDEIGEMSPGIQAKFLRVLEGHPFERVGGSKPITADVRVIAATNRDLEKDVADGCFRRDLYFRLHVLEIVVPPLRKRPEDIEEIANHYLQKFAAETGKKIRGFSDEAVQQLVRYRWPGNVRELKNVVERAVVLCLGPEIVPSELLLSNLGTAGDTVDVGQVGLRFAPCSLADAERQHILGILNYTGWNKSRAASILGVERSTLDRKIRRYLLTEDSGSAGRSG
jgi:transcriptional regulator with GAF, ATPase, and Fis domain